ncbi:hypothetical protein VKT23_013806 [Stygiomarasmius scandens]|uniref:CxC1-like cysteine cluster associated with KDZ transposases domain-containing protein n=1 Tax=Marasmiellus scandens TaxID=2682957 RepID=A0ABR1J6X0_9AGAR
MVARPRILPKSNTNTKPAPSLKVTETTASTSRSQREDNTPQVYLGRGRALFQDHAASTRPEGQTPAARADEGFVVTTPYEPSHSKHYRKREQQLTRWNEVLPVAREAYMELLRLTNDLRDVSPNRLNATRCSCCVNARELKVDIVRFDKFETVYLWASECRLAIVQLLRCGLFPCAPKQPTLAVDIRMLDFVSRLFLRISPNHTAWCGAVEDFLRSQGYRLQGKDPLRRRFGNALQWFNSLKAENDVFVKSLLSRTRTQLLSPASPSPDSQGPSRRPPVTMEDAEDEESPSLRIPDHADTDFDLEFTSGDASRVLQPKRRHSQQEDISNVQDPCDPPLSRPSEYLRERCPICFGGHFDPENKRLELSDIIVCLDANFTQRHNTRGRDPARRHPDTFFIPEADVAEVQDRVDAARDKSSRPAKKSKNTEDPEDDRMEHGMRVSKAVLDLCGGSFKAAHEFLAKVVTAGCDVTGLMALLCRHDRPLFVVNMNTPGERQHYAIALIEKLFEHLPTFVDVGLLYDIGCQLERSCLKWGLLTDYMDRLTFAISVFHAFGHQWACQIIYHLRKCVGFGLSDGEGAERLWHSIQRLIAYTRVAGYHLRLYTLDSQFHFGNEESLLRMGHWIRRKLRLSEDKRAENEELLAESMKDVEFLRSQWVHQVHVQTQPLPAQSKMKGKLAVQECIRLRGAQQTLKKKMNMFQNILQNERAAQHEIADAEIELPKAIEGYTKMSEKVRQKEALLGVDEKTQLYRMVNNEFILKSMNARALKSRIGRRVVDRKWELERFERINRHKRSTKKLDDHTENAVKRRDPGIQELVRKYNKLVNELRDLHALKKCPRKAVVPNLIDFKNLFSLDIDDAFWQDLGLGDDDNDETGPPPWMSDDDVRKGIRAMLEIDRCNEEDDRLAIEMQSMKQWFTEEWQVLIRTIETTDHPDIHHQLDLRRKRLCQLCVVWQGALADFGGEWMNDWGPSEEEMADARAMEQEAFVDGTDEDQGLDVDFETDVDPVVMEHEETVALTEVYRTNYPEDVE